jgi:hypothetical protein
VPAPSLSSASRTVCRERFFAALGEVSTMPPIAKVAELGGSVLKTKKLNGTMNNGDFWAEHIVQRYKAIEKDAKHYKSVVDLSEESIEVKKAAFKTIENIKADVSIINTSSATQRQSHVDDLCARLPSLVSTTPTPKAGLLNFCSCT